MLVRSGAQKTVEQSTSGSADVDDDKTKTSAERDVVVEQKGTSKELLKQEVFKGTEGTVFKVTIEKSECRRCFSPDSAAATQAAFLRLVKELKWWSEAERGWRRRRKFVRISHQVIVGALTQVDACASRGTAQLGTQRGGRISGRSQCSSSTSKNQVDQVCLADG